MMIAKFYFVLGVCLIGLFLLIRNFILFYKYRKEQDVVYQILTVFLGVNSINEIICTIYGLTCPGENLIMSHAHYQLQFLFGSLMYYYLIKNAFFRKIVVVTTLSFYCITFYYCYKNPEIMFTVNAIEVFIISVILILYALFYLYTIIDKEQWYVYFSMGLIMYLLCSSVVFFSGNLDLVLCEKPYIDIWVFDSIFIIIYQLLIYKDWKILIKENHAK